MVGGNGIEDAIEIDSDDGAGEEDAAAVSSRQAAAKKAKIAARKQQMGGQGSREVEEGGGKSRKVALLDVYVDSCVRDVRDGVVHFNREYLAAHFKTCRMLATTDLPFRRFLLAHNNFFFYITNM